MSGHIEIGKLKEHPRNNHYFTELTGEKYEEVKRSIAENGIRDPIKCSTAFTVISGHQRLRIAKELGMETVPVQIIDVDEWEAEYLLIAENVERRGQAETDPIKKSRIANFLKEYWGVRQGSRSDLVNNSPSSKDVANAIGESIDNTKRIIKLNDLIPELQDLISEGKLGTTAGEQLAHLTEDNQRALLNVLGEEIERTTVAKAKEYRSVQSEGGEYEQRLRELQEAKEQAEREAEQARQSEQIALRKLEEEQAKKPKVIEKEVVKEIDKTDYERINKLNEEIELLNEQIRKSKEDSERLQDQLKKQQERTKEYNKLKNELDETTEKLLALSKEQTKKVNRRTILDNASYMSRDVGAWVRRIKHYILERDADMQGDPDVNRAINAMINTLEETLAEVRSWQEVKKSNNETTNTSDDVLDVDFEEIVQ